MTPRWLVVLLLGAASSCMPRKPAPPPDPHDRSWIVGAWGSVELACPRGPGAWENVGKILLVAVSPDDIHLLRVRGTGPATCDFDGVLVEEGGWALAFAPLAGGARFACRREGNDLAIRREEPGFTVSARLRRFGPPTAVVRPAACLSEQARMLGWRQKKLAWEEAEKELSERWGTPATGPEASARWAAFKALARPGDELWSFTSPPAAWEQMAGRAGYVLFRGGKYVTAYVAMLN